MNIMFIHDIDRQENTSFIEYYLSQYYYLTRCDFAPKYVDKEFTKRHIAITEAMKESYIFIKIFSSKQNITNKKIRDMQDKLDRIYASPYRDIIYIPPNTNVESAIQSFIKIKQSPIVTLDSNILLSREILPLFFSYKNQTNEKFLNNYDKNLCVPLVSYKYHYKKVYWNNKEYVVKNFIKCKDNFYNNIMLEGDAHIPDYDERFLLTTPLLKKLNARILPLSPSPLLHNWRNFVRIVRHNSYNGPPHKDKDVLIHNMAYAAHKFEYIRDGDV